MAHNTCSNCDAELDGHEACWSCLCPVDGAKTTTTASSATKKSAKKSSAKKKRSAKK